jgi:tripartite ATP-independent transporter DctP family solute receptor
MAAVKKGILTLIAIFVPLVVSCTKVDSNKDAAKAAPEQKPQAEQAAKPTEKPAQAKIVFKVGSGGSITLPMSVAMQQYFEGEVEKRSNGKIDVEVYPASQLGDDVKLVEQLRSGNLECAIPVPSPLVGLVPQLAIFDTPFLFKSTALADKLLDGELGQQLNKLFEEKGLVNLGWGEMGFRQTTNSKRDIRKPEDLQGLKIRTMENAIHIATWRALGTVPTPMPVSEVFTAIQQGAIDGQENPVSGFYGWKIYEVNKHITLTGHVYSPNTILVSKKIWDTYDEETKKILSEVGKETAMLSRKIAREQEGKLVKEMQDSGCTIVTLSEEEKVPFQKATASVWDDVSKRVGKDMFDSVLKQIQ